MSRFGDESENQSRRCEMAEQSRKMMYGVSTWLYEKQDLGEALTKIAAAGFSIVEIWANEYHLDPRINPNLKSIERVLRVNKLCVDSIHTPFSGLDIGYPDESLLPGWLEVMEECLAFCRELGAYNAVVHLASHNQRLDGRQEAEGLKLVEKFVHELIALGLRFGVEIALENLPKHGSPDYTHSLQSLSRMFPGDEVGFCLDVGHAAMNGFDVEQEIKAAGRRLQSVHVSNNDGSADAHWEPYRGVLDWDKIEGSLRASGYEGPLFLEVNGGADPDAVLETIKCFAERQR